MLITAFKMYIKSKRIFST